MRGMLMLENLLGLLGYLSLFKKSKIYPVP